LEYGYDDKRLSPGRRGGKTGIILGSVLALAFIAMVWYAMDQKLLHGSAWISPTYDNEDWRTNEGNLHTFGAWDIETHIWKTDFMIQNWPNIHWNPYWYLGMPLFKYYQMGFYFVNWGLMALLGLSSARSALLLVIFSHLLAAMLTFLLSYKISKKILVSALSAIFVLANTFITTRSYGWEPITVVFLFLYPLGLLLFLREPLKPFRFWLVLVLGLSFIAHPLLWFSLNMTMGLYLIYVALIRPEVRNIRFLLGYFGAVFMSIVLGGIQFIPQITYDQVTSGAHMGVKYLPFQQVAPNIISLKDFFFDAGNLKGPGPIVMIAFFLLIFFAVTNRKRLIENELAGGLAFVLTMMVLFYYLEGLNIFPMNLLRSIQYHRIIPEFIITAAALVAALSNIAVTKMQRAVYTSMLVTFFVASGIVVYIIQGMWVTAPSISESPEFIYDDIEGRISFPYTDQSLAVRSSFTEIPQTYGYYEQGITNSYDDELFSVSSGYHNANLTILYLKAANVGRLYVNNEEGERDRIMVERLKSVLDYENSTSRYSYFKVPLKDPGFAQAVSASKAAEVELLEPGCREIFKEVYCGSAREEFVGTDNKENAYLQAYVSLLEENHTARATISMEHPDRYIIDVKGAGRDTAIVVKMTYDHDFTATVSGEQLEIVKFGPDFMLIEPGREGDYSIVLEYNMSRTIMLGGLLSTAGFVFLLGYSLLEKRLALVSVLEFKEGDMS